MSWPSYPCLDCGHKYNSRQSLWRHEQRKPESCEKKFAKSLGLHPTFNCTDCQFTHTDRRRIGQHRRKMPASCQKYQRKCKANELMVELESRTAFKAWKREMEDESAVLFVKRAGDKKYPNGVFYSRYYCSRARGKCRAFIRAKISPLGTVNAVYSNVHRGHGPVGEGEEESDGNDTKMDERKSRKRKGKDGNLEGTTPAEIHIEMPAIGVEHIDNSSEIPTAVVSDTVIGMNNGSEAEEVDDGSNFGDSNFSNFVEEEDIETEQKNGLLVNELRIQILEKKERLLERKLAHFDKKAAIELKLLEAQTAYYRLAFSKLEENNRNLLPPPNEQEGMVPLIGDLVAPSNYSDFKTNPQLSLILG